MNNKNRSLVLVLSLAIVTFSSYLAINTLNNQTSVLGDMAPTPSIRYTTPTRYPQPTSTPQVIGNIPCDVINDLQRQYCNNPIVPTRIIITTTTPARTMPTRVPTMTPRFTTRFPVIN